MGLFVPELLWNQANMQWLNVFLMHSLHADVIWQNTSTSYQFGIVLDRLWLAKEED